MLSARGSRVRHCCCSSSTVDIWRLLLTTATATKPQTESSASHFISRPTEDEKTALSKGGGVELLLLKRVDVPETPSTMEMY